MEPNKERLRLWVEALRSGDYKQGSGRLRSIPTPNEPLKHCCLGVACEVAIEQGVELDPKVFETHSFLPRKVAEWLGIWPDGVPEDGVSEVDPDFITIPASFVTIPARSEDGKTVVTVVAASILNDGGDDFAFIADAIERTYGLVES